MSFLPFVFSSPLMLAALVALPAIWWLLRLTPPKPVTEVFPPLRILAGVLKREETPSKSPWWLTALRMLMAALIILAIADPVVNPRIGTLSSSGPLALVIDNGWATANDWERRVRTADALITEAESADVPVSIVFSADRENDGVPGTATAARTRLAAAAPRPLRPNRTEAVAALRTGLDGTRAGTLAFISDGIASGDDTVMRDLASLSPQSLRLIEGDGGDAIALTGAVNEADAMRITATRLESAAPRTVALTAFDTRGRAISNGSIIFPAGEATASGTLTAPFELRNDFARIGIDGLATAGSTYLLDDGFRRRRVALLSGEARDQSQPLLSPLYYINRALAPYADLVQPTETDLAVALPQLLEQKPSMVIMADIGRLPEDTTPAMTRWIQNGGTLVRFAGPRLAAAPADDPLVPVRLRQGERALGGTLSWSEPQPLAPYPATSPFAGMPRPEGITVNRQVLAEPTADLSQRTWASLADGTPLVTTRTLGAGRIVLFHVSAEATWSNLPISGDFVEMLRRVVQLSRSGGVTSEGGAAAQALPPYRLMNADGTLVTETGGARPLEIAAGVTPVADVEHPPGLYGSEEGFVALNLLPRDATLRPIESTDLPMPYTSEALIGSEAWSMKPALFTAALILLLVDTLIVLFMAGTFARPNRLRTATALLAIGFAALGVNALSPQPAQAQAIPPTQAAPTQGPFDDTRPGDEEILGHLDNTHLAYVVTGESEVDRLSERGLAGLTEFLTYRTTLEPGAPVGLDISKDELSFYSLIYWPISANAEMPSPAAISRIDAYMRAGGTVLFDTRDQLSSLSAASGTSPNTERLQAILADLDIPPLEPVPTDNVLTKSFYLLTSFPGRYTGSPLWIEAQPQSTNEQSERPARSGDGVSPIMITGNDLAGAWATDGNGAPLLPTVPPDEMQREYAFRSGVNIMMYMLTGNYKADQVHIPALLERLGQ
ncbi:putative membrane protein (TIGR02226 family) [Rhizobium sp. PP-F2F-G38]|nr:putative membrane protein (TIGR02226 family) [Rhizobium sp. PP-F2F-G38]